MTEIAKITAWCLGSVWTDRLYATGEPVELTEAEFDTLEALGVVSAEPPAAQAPAGEPKVHPSEAVRAAIATLPAEGFDDKGAPKPEAVRAAMTVEVRLSKAKFAEAVAGVWAEMSKGA